MWSLQTDDKWSEKLIWAFRSDELKTSSTTLLLNRKFNNIYQHLGVSYSEISYDHERSNQGFQAIVCIQNQILKKAQSYFPHFFLTIHRYGTFIYRNKDTYASWTETNSDPLNFLLTPKIYFKTQRST